LVGKIGEKGQSVFIGNDFTLGSHDGAGTLYLLIPSPWNNASTGNYKVRLGSD
jgi:hypothetical protein